MKEEKGEKERANEGVTAGGSGREDLKNEESKGLWKGQDKRVRGGHSEKKCEGRRI